jgi:histidinol-phosphate aminotransferase
MSPTELLREHLRSFEPYQTTRELYAGAVDLYLDANEGTIRADDPAAPLGLYPDPEHTALRQAAAAYYHTPADHIFAGNGSDEIIDLLVRAYCEPGLHSVLTCPPTFSVYSLVAQVNRVAETRVPTTEAFGIAPDRIVEACAQHPVRLVFLCSPNNPTANSQPHAALRHVLERVTTALVVVDEAYVEYATQGSVAPWLAEFPRLVVLRTLSKAHVLAGARVGFALAHPEVLRGLHAVRAPYNISTLDQHAATRALHTAAHGPLAERVARNAELRAAFGAFLAGLPWVEHVWPSDANFFLLRVADAHTRFERLIAEHRILAKRIKSPDLPPNCLRLTIPDAPHYDRICAALQALA